MPNSNFPVITYPYGGTGLQVLGTNGQVLGTDGSSILWVTPSAPGTGTVTSVATGAGLTGGPITSSGTISAIQTDLTDTGTDGIVITNGTNSVFGMSPVTVAQHVADTSHNGYLNSTDWNTFNGKQSSLTIGNLTDVGTDGITVTGGTGAVIGSGTSIAQQVADASHNGYLSSTDWSTFNGKQDTLAIGALDAQAANANGLALVSSVLSAQSADATHPGMVNITTQTFAGNKTFTGTLQQNTANSTTYLSSAAVATPAAAAGFVVIDNTSSTSSSGSFLNLQAHNTSGNAQNGYFGLVSTNGAGAFNPTLVIGVQTGSGNYNQIIQMTNGLVGINATTVGTVLTVGGPIALKQPATKNLSTYTVLGTDSTLIITTTNITLTLPTASSFPGRILYLLNVTNNSAISNASNVVPLASTTAGTAILAATAGKFAMLQSDGSNWITIMAN